MKRPSHRQLRSCLIVLFWLILWQSGAWIINNNILLVGPFEVIHGLAALLRESGFWLSVFTSFAKISLGFLAAFVLGIPRENLRAPRREQLCGTRHVCREPRQRL